MFWDIVFSCIFHFVKNNFLLVSLAIFFKLQIDFFFLSLIKYCKSFFLIMYKKLFKKVSLIILNFS